jgi:hypothetical protein
LADRFARRSRYRRTAERSCSSAAQTQQARGARIGFWQRSTPAPRGELKKVPINGGPVVTVGPAAMLAGASWGAHDRIVFAEHERETRSRCQSLFEIASSYRPGAFPYRRYDVTPDGRRFLMFEDRDAEEPPVTQIVVVRTGRRS